MCDLGEAVATLFEASHPLGVDFVGDAGILAVEIIFRCFQSRETTERIIDSVIFLNRLTIVEVK